MLRQSVLFSPVVFGVFENVYRYKRRKTSGVQTGCSTADLKDQNTQCGSTKGSYLRNEKKENFANYQNLLQNYLWDKNFILS